MITAMHHAVITYWIQTSNDRAGAVPDVTASNVQLHSARRVQQLCYKKAHHVHGLWHVGKEVSDPPPFLDVVLGVGLQCMNHVWELDAITDEEHRHVVANEIPVALTSVELDSKSTRITQSFW